MNSINSLDERELSDAELDGVAGGFFAMFFASWLKASSTGGDHNNDFSDMLTVANGSNAAV